MSKITFSIVSHGQFKKVNKLIEDIRNLELNDYQIIVILNTKDESSEASFSSIDNLLIIQNREEKTYGLNHNMAFEYSTGNFFVVLNPDLRLGQGLKGFLNSLDDIPSEIGIISAQEYDLNGNKRANSRKFPTIWNLFLRRVIGRDVNIKTEKSGEYHFVDWVAGMFSLNGFDSRYQMYCEDIDICKRAKLIGFKVAINDKYSFIHEGGFESRKNIKYFIIHLKSMIKFLIK